MTIFLNSRTKPARMACGNGKDFVLLRAICETMKKTYTYPTMEILPLGMRVALCTSPGGGGGGGNVGGGEDPDIGRAPRQTDLF